MKFFARIIGILCSLFFVLPILAQGFRLPTDVRAQAESDKIMIYFHSSETSIDNFKSLKMEFDQYLSRFGAFEFQPFNDRDAFESHVGTQKRCVLILSGWHYGNIAEKFAIRPLLSGTRNGKNFQKRILVAQNSATIASAKTGTIASASSIRYTRNVLTEIFEDEQAAISANILTVPKDIDALIALGFGMSGFALTTENSLEKLKLMNPVLYKKTKVLAEGRNSLLLIVCTPEKFSQGAERIVRILRDMPSEPEGKKQMKMLGLDGWQEMNRTDSSLIRTP